MLVHLSLLLLGTLAAPLTGAQHELEYVKRDNVPLPLFHPPAITKTFPLESIDKRDETPETTPPIAEILELAKQSLAKEYNLDVSDILIKEYSTDKAGVTHIYGVRTIEGIPVENNTFNVHVMKGKVISMTSSFAGTLKRNVQVSPPKEVISLAEAVTIAEKQYNTPRDSFPHKMVYIQLPSGKFAYCYQFQLKDLESKKPRWYQVTIDSAIGQVVQAVNYVRFATFKVIPLPVNDQTSGKFKTVVNPEYLPASPFGWNKDANGSYTETRGNNVDAQIKGSSFLRVDGGKNLTFKSDFNASAFASSAESQKTAIINSFYIANLLHDIFYEYGFIEAAGNFQNKNFKKNGVEGDAVTVLNNQGINSAFFSTPPDGQAGVLKLSVWQSTLPFRHTALDNTITVHEYFHGVSSRTTGGSRQANCLDQPEGLALGEGWSDAAAMFLTRKAKDNRNTPFIIGKYAKPILEFGLRSVPYTTNMTENSLKFNDLVERIPDDQSHLAGEVWATVLNELYWKLVDNYGYSSKWHESDSLSGNIVALRLIMKGLALQPCNPTFLQARDAIIKADEFYYLGFFKCDIWSAFAKRGFGIDAKATNYTNGHAVPKSCKLWNF